MDDGNWEQLRRAMRLSYSFVGGVFNPILSIGANTTTAESLLDRFWVDALYPVQETKPINDFIAAQKYLFWPTKPRTLFWQKWEHRPPYSAIVDVYHSLRRLYEESRSASGDGVVLKHCSWASDDPLADLFLASIGEYEKPSDLIPDYWAIWERMPKVERIDLLHQQVPGEAIREWLTPTRLCRLFLDRDGPSELPAVFVGEVDRFSDILTFWNLRAAGIQIAFIDLRYFDRLEPTLRSQRELSERIPPTRVRESDTLNVWARTEVFEQREALSRLGDKKLLHRVDDEMWGDFGLTVTRPCWPERHALASVDQEAGNFSAAFSLPEKPFFDDEQFVQQYVAASISGFDHQYVHENNSTFFPPLLPELNEYYSRHSIFHYDKARADIGIVGGALRVLLDTGAADLTLRAFSGQDLIRRWLSPGTVGRASNHVVDRRTRALRHHGESPESGETNSFNRLAGIGGFHNLEISGASSASGRKFLIKKRGEQSELTGGASGSAPPDLSCGVCCPKSGRAYPSAPGLRSGAQGRDSRPKGAYWQNRWYQ